MSEIIYTSSATAYGGIEGKVQSDDQVIDMKTVIPGGLNDEELQQATNPEQLFAAAYATCYESALQIVANKEQVEFESVVTASVSLFEDETKEGYKLAVDLKVKGNNIDKNQFEELVKKANGIWPFSDAKRRNMDINIEVH